MFGNYNPNALVISENEKIYQLSQGTIKGVEYRQRNLGSEDEIFTPVFLREQYFEDDIIDAAVAEFGIVVETKNNLYVLLSTGEEIYTVKKIKRT